MGGNRRSNWRLAVRNAGASYIKARRRARSESLPLSIPYTIYCTASEEMHGNRSSKRRIKWCQIVRPSSVPANCRTSRSCSRTRGSRQDTQPTSASYRYSRCDRSRRFAGAWLRSTCIWRACCAVRCCTAVVKLMRFARSYNRAAAVFFTSMHTQPGVMAGAQGIQLQAYAPAAGWWPWGSPPPQQRWPPATTPSWPQTPATDVSVGKCVSHSWNRVTCGRCVSEMCQ